MCCVHPSIFAAGCADSANTAKNAGEAHVTGLEFVYRVNNLFAAPQVKGAEAEIEKFCNNDTCEIDFEEIKETQEEKEELEIN